MTRIIAAASMSGDGFITHADHTVDPLCVDVGANAGTIDLAPVVVTR